MGHLKPPGSSTNGAISTNASWKAHMQWQKWKWPFQLQLSLNSPFWKLLEAIYALPSPPSPRQRSASSPMQVLCVGLPRSGTESLQQALLYLGYSHTYHGWDIVYDNECHSPGWVALARKKFYQGEAITAADFDALLGHSVAVTDAAASVFASDMIAAYPDAKVVLNMRGDVDAWVRSLESTLVKANRSWGFWIASLLDRECFWAWHVYERFLWPLLFRAPDGDMARAVTKNARWIQKGNFPGQIQACLDIGLLTD